MTILGSRDPRDMHTDPEPWERHSVATGLLTRHAQVVEGFVSFLPRKEFIPVVTHEYNPVLATVGRVVGRRNLYGDELTEWIVRLRNMDTWHPRWTPEHVEHATVVLRRLARYIRSQDRGRASA
ncbi:hypothetical protein [Leifsonia sp. Leaf264]|uniref:hypothetical protein n=1 Tax=Leifsonia sp. Leaf264 TaxID=1736314 RepID=UPI0007010314|nr:hypothetical protein [Leifsonia sp. Leaf264]KQO98464.1 hypothetical protein ASF30_10405 [Leifsonia sp. Leaf264]